VNEDDQRDKVRAKIAASRNMTGKEPTPSYVATLLAEHGLPSSDAEVATFLGSPRKGSSKGKGKPKGKEAAPAAEPAPTPEPAPAPAPGPVEIAPSKKKAAATPAAGPQLVLVDCQTDVPSVSLEDWLARAFEEGSLRFPGQPIVLTAGQEELARLLTRFGAIVVRGTR
jgi:hypothetical protein